MTVHLAGWLLHLYPAFAWGGGAIPLPLLLNRAVSPSLFPALLVGLLVYWQALRRKTQKYCFFLFLNSGAASGGGVLFTQWLAFIRLHLYIFLIDQKNLKSKLPVQNIHVCFLITKYLLTDHVGKET